jgi:hypothetical protein
MSKDDGAAPWDWLELLIRSVLTLTCAAVCAALRLTQTAVTALTQAARR